ncbi:MAG: DUF2202 domain-containing protein [Anaerolineaceae bacterium]|nr:DUF2202 domain-containing protein [Anaerolineaceae bacterium]
MIKKIIVISMLVAVTGLLVFGAINRTLAKNETRISTENNTFGGGNGRGNNTEGLVENESSANSGVSSSADHELLLDQYPIGDLDQQETEALQFMLEEEKLARDVYTVLYSKWGQPIFQNIAGSEQKHMDSVQELFDRYQIDAFASDQAGVFVNPDLQVLYDQLIEKGSLSIADAMLVGGAIEEIDILDLKERINQTNNEDIQMVFQNLLKGSTNHLRAFSSNYARQSGVAYQAQYMTQTEFEKYQSFTSGNSNTNRQGGHGRGTGGGGRS